MSNGTTTWTYTYDANGMRTGRTNGTTTYTYVYNGGQLVQMTVGNDTLYFAYDAYGFPMTVTHNGVVYYYVTNIQGDVVAILDSTGVAVARYYYDAWGNEIPYYSTASSIGQLNPLRYRGYVYDQETELYYLQSRYYNPEWGRFINADSYVATGQGLLGNNMFAYCANNPVSNYDFSGKYLVSIEDRFTLGFGMGGNRAYNGSAGANVSTGYGSREELFYEIESAAYDSHDYDPDSIYHEQMFLLQLSEPSFSIRDRSVTLGSASVTLLTSGWEFENVDLSLLDIGHAEVNAGFEDGQFNVGAMASIWKPSATVTIFGIDISLSAHVGSIGGGLNVGSGAFTIGAAIGWGLELSIDW